MFESWIWYIFTFVYLHLVPGCFYFFLSERREVVKCFICGSCRLSGPRSTLAWLGMQHSSFRVVYLDLGITSFQLKQKLTKHQQTNFLFGSATSFSCATLTVDMLVFFDVVTSSITQRFVTDCLPVGLFIYDVWAVSALFWKNSCVNEPRLSTSRTMPIPFWIRVHRFNWYRALVELTMVMMETTCTSEGEVRLCLCYK